MHYHPFCVTNLLNFLQFVHQDLQVSKAAVRKILDSALQKCVTASQRIFMARDCCAHPGIFLVNAVWWSHLTEDLLYNVLCLIVIMMVLNILWFHMNRWRKPSIIWQHCMVTNDRNHIGLLIY